MVIHNDHDGQVYQETAPVQDMAAADLRGHTHRCQSHILRRAGVRHPLVLHGEFVDAAEPLAADNRPIRQPQHGGQQAAGPYEVAEAGVKTFEVLVGGERQRVSVDRLKPHTGLAPVTAANPACRGRPPKEQTVVVAATPCTYPEVVAGVGSLYRSCIVIVFIM
jgi:hypothetical protein